MKESEEGYEVCSRVVLCKVTSERVEQGGSKESCRHDLAQRKSLFDGNVVVGWAFFRWPKYNTCSWFGLQWYNAPLPARETTVI